MTRCTSRRAPRLKDSLATLLDARICGIALVNFATYLAAQGVILTTLVLLKNKVGALAQRAAERDAVSNT